MLKVFSIALLAFALSSTVHAEVKSSPYYQIKSYSIHEEPVNQESMMTIRKSIQERQALRMQGLDDKFNPGDVLNPVKEVDATLDVIINMGAKIWKIFEASTPVVNLATKRANALPRDATDWRDMSNWSDLEGRQYSIEYKNGFNATVVKFSVLMTYSHSGQFKGKGKYLSDVGFLVNEYWVAPLYKLEGESQVVGVRNVGKANDVIAAMELNMVWRVSNVLVKSQNAMNYFIRGDGPLTVREVKN
jgi:hypothetical protein